MYTQAEIRAAQDKAITERMQKAAAEMWEACDEVTRMRWINWAEAATADLLAVGIDIRPTN